MINRFALSFFLCIELDRTRNVQVHACLYTTAIAKEHAFEELYDKLDSKEGPKIIYKLAKAERERRTRDLTDIAFVKDRDGNNLY